MKTIKFLAVALVVAFAANTVNAQQTPAKKAPAKTVAPAPKAETKSVKPEVKADTTAHKAHKAHKKAAKKA